MITLKYLYGGIVQYSPGDYMPTRTLNDFEFLQILHGNPIYQANGREFHLAPGAIVCGKPQAQESYIWDRKDITIHSYFHFDCHMLPDDFPPLNEWPTTINEPRNSLRVLMEEIVQLSTRVNLFVDEKNQTIPRLLTAFIDLYTSPLSKEQKMESELPLPVQKALRAIRLSIDRRIHEVQLDSLAEAATVDKKHLCKLFQKHIGYSPMKTMRLLQLQLALSLLIRSGLSIKEIALKAGFEDPLYFSRYFKKELGLSPVQVRKDLDQSIPPPRVSLPESIAAAQIF